MSQVIALTAQSRSEVGKAEVRRLRRLHSQVPAIVYGGKSEPKSIKLPENDVLRVFKFEAAYTQMLDLSIDGQHETVVVKDVTMHPFKPLVVHIDFLRIEKNKPITMRVPLHFIGEDKGVGVSAGGRISHLMTDLEVTCLPADLPEAIDLDVLAVEIGQSLHLSDIVLPKGVSFSQVLGDENNHSVYSIHAPHVEEEESMSAPVAPESASAESADSGSSE